TPVAPFESATSYRIRVTNAATDAGGTPMDSFYLPATSFTVRYFHTITIDGVNDFEMGEVFPTSSLGHFGYVAWDDSYLYLGMDSADLGANDPTVFFVAYLGGVPGSNLGQIYNTQEPMLP